MLEIILNDPDWLTAQERDGAFVTQYAKSNPKKEDLAESALFSLLKNPGRMPTEVKDWIEENIPNRLDYISTLFKDMCSRLLMNECLQRTPLPVRTSPPRTLPLRTSPHYEQIYHPDRLLTLQV